MKLAVLDFDAREPRRDLSGAAGSPDAQPSFLLDITAFAAASAGAVYRKDQSIPAGQKEVLLVLRGHLKNARQALVELRAAGKTSAIVWHEPSTFDIASRLGNPKALQLFQELCQRSDGALATTPDALPFFAAAGARHTEVIPIPVPIGDPASHPATPAEERHGIFVGSRRFGVPLENHLAALLAIRPLAASMFEPVTILNDEGWRGRRLIARLGYDERLLRVIEDRLSFAACVREISRHKLVWQLDASAGSGRMAAAALLAGVPCVGGLGATERLVFPDLCGHGRDLEQLFDLATRLLEHPHDCQSLVERATDIARARLSFEAVNQRLESFFRRIAR